MVYNLDERESSGKVTPIDLEAAYQQSDEYGEVTKKLSSIMDDLTAKEDSRGRISSKSVSYATNIFWQVGCVRFSSVEQR